MMREGFIHSKQCPQPMVFPENYSDPALRGKPKGIKQVLLERGFSGIVCVLIASQSVKFRLLCTTKLAKSTGLSRAKEVSARSD